MKILCTLLLIFFSLSALKAEELGVDFSFDNREWECTYYNLEGNILVQQFGVKGDDADNWKELVLIQTISEMPLTLEECYSDFKEEITPYNAHVKLLSKTTDSLFFEWWLSDKTENAKHEWQKIFKKDDTICVLRYMTKNLSSVEKNRSVWEKILKKASLTASLEKLSYKAMLPPFYSAKFNDKLETFSLFLPIEWAIKEWEMQPTKQMPELKVIQHIIKPSKGKGFVLLSSVAKMKKNETVQDQLDKMVDAFSKGSPTTKIAMEKNLHLASNEKIQGVLLETTTVDGTMYTWCGIKTQGDLFQKLTYAAKAEEFDTDFPLFEKMVQTIHLIRERPLPLSEKIKK